MVSEEGTPKRTCLRLICDYTHNLRLAMVIGPFKAIDYAEELVRTKVFSEEEAKVVDRYKAAATEFNIANTDMFFLGKRHGGDDR